MAITPGKSRPRRLKGATPKVSVSSDMSGVNALKTGVQRGAAEIGRGLQNFSKGVTDLGAGIASVREKKDSLSAMEANNKSTTEINDMVNELQNSGEQDIGRLGQTYRDRADEILSRNGTGLSGSAKEKYEKNSSGLKLRYDLNMSNWTVDEINKREVQARQTQIDNSVASLQNNPTVEGYYYGVMQNDATIQGSKNSPEVRAAMDQMNYDVHGEAYFKGKQPETSLEEFEAMEDAVKKGETLEFTDVNIYKAMSGDARENTKKELVARANAFKKHQEGIDKEFDNDLIRQAQKEVFVSPDAYRARTKEGAKAIEKLMKDKGKTVKAETKTDQYSETSEWLRLHEAPASITNAEIIKRVDDPKDQEHFMGVRDQYKKAQIGNVEYKNMLKNFGDDFTANKFGKGHEGRQRYADQLRTFEDYMVNTPDADAREYYDRLMDPINAAYYDDEFFREKTVGPEDVEIAREIEDVTLKAEPADRETKRDWLSRARIGNPEYSIQELSDFYDEEVK